MNGRIAIDRQIMDWEWWGDLNVFRLWMVILMLANWQDKKWQGQTIKRGSFITSYPTLADISGLSIQQTRTAISKLKSTGEIQQIATNKYQLIIVVNYEKYQESFGGNQQTDNSQLTDNQHSNNIQSTFNQHQLNKDNKGNKGNKEIYISKLPAKVLKDEFEKLWKLYPKKHGKDKAYSYYEKARKNGTSYEEIEQGILAYVEYIRANETDMQYVKQGVTFFSQRAWQDDWSVRRQKKSKNPFQELLGG